MKNKILIFFILFIFIFGKIDNKLDYNMYLHSVVQPLIFFILGYFFLKKKNKKILNSFYIIIIFMNFIFWMLPIALDSTIVNKEIDIIYHFSYFISGIFFKKKIIKKKNFIFFFILYIHSIIMLLSLGIFYIYYTNQACTNYSIIQQIETGKLIIITIPIFSFIYFKNFIFFLKKGFF